jgi:hypothetical protein
MTVHHNFEAESEHDIHARAREIRAGLPGQLRQQRLRTAALLYGPLCSMDELRVRIAGSIPRRFGLIRLARLESIERTEVVIPDEVLVIYADAVDRGLFARFMVARRSSLARRATPVHRRAPRPPATCTSPPGPPGR